jgi:hypothetical protein
MLLKVLLDHGDTMHHIIYNDTSTGTLFCICQLLLGLYVVTQLVKLLSGVSVLVRCVSVSHGEHIQFLYQMWEVKTYAV